MSNEEKLHVIVNTDPGIDDAYALLLLLKAEKANKIKIEAIIASIGNTTIHNACKNIVRLLEIVKRTDIPIYKGIRESIIVFENSVLVPYYGTDGFADLTYETEPNLSIVKSKSGIVAMQEIVIQNPKKITLICLGPLTNIAIAQKMYDNFISNVKHIFIMGGNNTAVGNVTSTAEYNFYADPEAIRIVLDSAKCPITILPLEPCRATNIDSNWHFNVLGKIDTSEMKLLNRAEEKMYAKHPGKNWIPYDAFLVAAIIYPYIVNHSTKHHASIELVGSLTRGQMVLDHLKKKESNVIIIDEINQERFMEIMLKSMQN